MDLLKFFIENNNSGAKTKESFLKKNYPELYFEIINYNNNDLIDLPFKQKIWHYINKIQNIPKCQNCGNNLKFKKSLTEGYGLYCSVLCANKCGIRKTKIKETNIVKYGGNAPICSDDVKNKIKESFIRSFGVDNVFKDKEYIKSKTIEKHNVDHISKLDSTKEKIKNTNQTKYGVSTPLVLPEIRQVGFDKKTEWFYSKYENLNVIGYTGKTIEIKCDKCNQPYLIERSLLSYRFENDINPCILCNPINDLKSFKEKQICEFLDEHNIKYIENDRNILKGQELDIFIPEHNIAIEFDGLFWHSDKFKDKQYHSLKTNECKKLGIRVVHIFEDEWDNKKEIVKSRIKTLLGLTSVRVFARNCEVKYVDTQTKTKFLEENHIQGSVGSKFNLGVYYNSNLISIMTFGKKRLNLGYKKTENNEYELLRFCNKLNHIVVGGASKLLKRFIVDQSPKEIISYADKRWSNGNLYEKLNFSFVKETTPNYYYVVNKKRESRFKYRKDVLVDLGYDSNKSEFEIMEERGIPKIYDCGNLLYKKSLK
jgi:ribosomal protein L34E